MKKIGFLIVISLFLPSLVLANAPSAGKKLSSKASMFSKALDSAKQKKENEIKKQDALKAMESANQSLLSLAKAYPEYKTQIESIGNMHAWFGRFAKEDLKESKDVIYGYIFQQLESMYFTIEKLPEEIRAQVAHIINHKYWIAINQEDACLARMAYMTCAHFGFDQMEGEFFYSGLRGN